MFQEERVHLGALPLQGFAYFTECERTVADDTCVRIDHSRYLARPAKIGSRVLVRLFERYIEIHDRLTLSLLRSDTWQHASARRRATLQSIARDVLHTGAGRRHRRRHAGAMPAMV